MTFLINSANATAMRAVVQPVCFVGLGSNLLVRDGGYRGTVVLTHSSRSAIRIEEGLIHAEAGAACPKVASGGQPSGLLFARACEKALRRLIERTEARRRDPARH